MDNKVSDDSKLPDAQLMVEIDAQAELDQALDELRGILSEPDRRRTEVLEQRIAELEQRTGDDAALVAAITPVLGDVIRRKIQEGRAEMIEVFYPIIAQLIGRAVAEAIRNLARSIDTRMRSSLSPAAVLRRIRGRLTGVSDGELSLRDALPFRITELFLIHRESGLLLLRLAHDASDGEDADLVSGMLTAIRDFVADAFGRGQTEGQLDEIQYGTQRILIETTRHATLAVVVDGIEPAGLREAMRLQLIEFENAHTEPLISYNGNAGQFASVAVQFRDLFVETPATQAVSAGGLTRSQRSIIVALGTGLMLCGLLACGGSAWWLRTELNRPRPVFLVVITATPAPSGTPTRTPTATPTSTLMPTLTPTPTATATRLPAPLARVEQQPANIRAEPARTGRVLEPVETGRTFLVIGRNASGGWWQVCCTARGEIGWIAAVVVELKGPVANVPIVAPTGAPTGGGE